MRTSKSCDSAVGPWAADTRLERYSQASGFSRWSFTILPEEVISSGFRWVNICNGLKKNCE